MATGYHKAALLLALFFFIVAADLPNLRNEQQLQSELRNELATIKGNFSLPRIDASISLLESDILNKDSESFSLHYSQSKELFNLFAESRDSLTKAQLSYSLIEEIGIQDLEMSLLLDLAKTQFIQNDFETSLANTESILESIWEIALGNANYLEVALTDMNTSLNMTSLISGIEKSQKNHDLLLILDTKKNFADINQTANIYEKLMTEKNRIEANGLSSQRINISVDKISEEFQAGNFKGSLLLLNETTRLLSLLDIINRSIDILVIKSSELSGIGANVGEANDYLGLSLKELAFDNLDLAYEYVGKANISLNNEERKFLVSSIISRANKRYGIVDFLKDNFFLLIFAAIIVILLLKWAVLKVQLKSAIKSMETLSNEKSTIKNMQKKLQQEYYKSINIDNRTFSKLSDAYAKRADYIERQIPMYEDRIKTIESSLKQFFMKDRKLGHLLVLVFLMLPAAKAEDCSYLLGKLPNRVELGAGERYSIDLQNGSAQFTWVPIMINLTGFALSSEGKLELFTSAEDYGTHSILIVAALPSGCYALKYLQIEILPRPFIIGYTPVEKNIVLSESDSLYFQVNASSAKLADKLSYYWYYDDKLVRKDYQTYIMRTNFSDSGKHNVKAVVVNSKGLNSSIIWILNILNKNRPPIIRYNIPNIVVVGNSAQNLFNLNSYIIDPDSERLVFTSIVENSINTPIDILVGKDGVFSIASQTSSPLTIKVRINASDPNGASVMTDTFDVKVPSNKELADYLEELKKIDCAPNIICGSWSACLPDNIEIRECYDANGCSGGNNLTDIQSCKFNSTCNDFLQNQGEEGVDCGGPCTACPSCRDELLNQGEEGVDCGGPCKSCPTCSDLIKNQEETDIDCGGPCSPCGDNQSCKTHIDCKNLVCTNDICQAASCYDSRKNQNEINVDCGGVCDPCQTCTDGIKNQGESDIDCGGPCKACVTCDDGIKNQGELFVDCGGPCQGCNPIEFILKLRLYLFLGAFVVFVFILIRIVRSILSKDKASNLLRFSRILFFLKPSLPDNSERMFIDAMNRLQNLKQLLFSINDSKKIVTEYSSLMNSFFKNLFELEEPFSIPNLKTGIRAKIKNPALAEVFIELYKLGQDMDAGSPLFKIEMSGRIEETIRLLSMTVEEIK
ncbi:MAG: hypothetical protein ABIJ34_03065 [archaeon]